jgi:hypothetical protein
MPERVLGSLTPAWSKYVRCRGSPVRRPTMFSGNWRQVGSGECRGSPVGTRLSEDPTSGPRAGGSASRPGGQAPKPHLGHTLHGSMEVGLGRATRDTEPTGDRLSGPGWRCPQSDGTSKCRNDTRSLPRKNGPHEPLGEQTRGIRDRLNAHSFCFLSTSSSRWSAGGCVALSAGYRGLPNVITSSPAHMARSSRSHHRARAPFIEAPGGPHSPSRVCANPDRFPRPRTGPLPNSKPRIPTQLRCRVEPVASSCHSVATASFPGPTVRGPSKKRSAPHELTLIRECGGEVRLVFAP